MATIVTATRVLNERLNPAKINYTDKFIGADFIYIIAPDTADEIELDAFLQIFLPLGVQRKIQLESPSVLASVNQVNTETVTRIPLEFKGYEMAVAFVPSSSDFLEVWVSSVNLPCDEVNDQLSRIEGKIDLCIATNVISLIVDAVLGGGFGGVLSETAQQILGPSARKLFKILNPIGAESPIWVDILPALPDLPNTINQASFETIIPPGFEWQPSYGYPDQYIVGWTEAGTIVANVNVREYF